MKFSYVDLISGDSIPVSGIGHIRPPKLKDLKPTGGIGTWLYNFYLNILSWDKEETLTFMKTAGIQTDKMAAKEDLTTYDVLVLIPNFRQLLRDAMAFFIDELLVWDDSTFAFKTYEKDDDQKVIGVINRNNYEDVRDMMLQVNYIGLGDKAKPTKFIDDKAKQMWEEIQEHLKKSKPHEDKRMELGNIISKLCAANSGYTLLNIYDLTIFQLYDQFFQYGYLRAMDLNERAFSVHGGKEFNFEKWLEPILKI